MELSAVVCFLSLICFSSTYKLGEKIRVNPDYDFEVWGQPQQIHLSYGESPSEMTVTWATLNYTDESIVEYGINGLDMYTHGKMRNFTDGGSEHKIFYVHQVTLTGLTPGQVYRYHCGSSNGWSEIFGFRAMPAGTNWSPRFVVYGDMGYQNPQSLPRIQYETQKGMYDAVLHVGDLGYNMEYQNGYIGDMFLKVIEPIAAYIPYMTCPGNHESAYNFTHYRYRFSMPKAGGDGQNLWYSFDIGPAHIISFSTEVYYYSQYGWELIVEQYRWLQQDLMKANLPENRLKRPWIIVMGHHPMYCTNSNDPTVCLTEKNAVRVGAPPLYYFGLEEMFYKYGVDLQIYAHEHSYERLWPVYKRTVCNGSYENPYVNPTGPVHIVTGSAGCYSKHDPFISHPYPWSALRNDDYGYSRMNIINSTHLYMEQVSDDKDGAVIDKMMLVKEVHGAGTYTCHNEVKS